MNYQDIITEIKNNKAETLNDIKLIIQQNTDTILSEIKNTNNIINELEKEVLQLKQDKLYLNKQLTLQSNKLKNIETQMRAKNIILFGYEEKPELSIAQNEDSLVDFLTSKLEVNFSKSNIEKLKRIGVRQEGKIRPLLISLNNERTKHDLLRNNKKLKGTGFKLQEDFTKETMEERNRLIPHLIEARNSGHRAFLKGNKLSVNNTLYSLETLQNKDQEACLDPLTVQEETEISSDEENNPVELTQQQDTATPKIQDRNQTSLQADLTDSKAVPKLKHTGAIPKDTGKSVKRTKSHPKNSLTYFLRRTNQSPRTPDNYSRHQTK